MIPNKFIKEINGYYILEKATCPRTNNIYKIGDKVIIKLNNKKSVFTINTLFCAKDSDRIFWNEKTFKDSDYERTHWAERPTGYFIEEIVNKITDVELKALKKAKSLVSDYNLWSI